MNRIFALLFLTTSLLTVYGQEDNSISCSDGVDNDGDGQIDCSDIDCQSLPNDGCLICPDGLSFADSLIEYLPGCPLVDPDPEGAIGVSDYAGNTDDQPQFVFLGQGGSIRLAFTNNLLANSGDGQEDLWVFEVGPEVESSTLEIRPFDAFTLSELQNSGIADNDLDGYYEIGSIGGAISGIDIDAILPGFAPGSLTFDAVEVVDIDDGSCAGATPGADIDAVCAISSIMISSVVEININATLSIYPNPAKGFISLETSEFDGAFPLGYTIVSSQGTALQGGDFSKDERIDVSELPKGMYFLHLVGKRKVVIDSFVKQ